MTDPAESRDATLLSDEELIQRQREDAETRAKALEVQRQMKEGEGERAGESP